MIRQAISCDICGAEKKQTNHWFVAHEQGDELRVTGWSSRNRLKPGTKHLCGQVCMHKLADIFMARVIAEKAGSAHKEAVAEERVPAARPATDSSLIAADSSLIDSSLIVDAEELEFESSARLISTPLPTASAPLQRVQAAYKPQAEVRLQPEARLQSEIRPQPEFRPQAELVSMPGRLKAEEIAASLDEPPRLTARHWRAEAWEREREREQRAQERRPDNATRRRFHA